MSSNNSNSKKVVGLDDVYRAVQIRQGGGSWAQVIEATGFNGATLRPHITEYLQREVLKRAAVNQGDRVDSPYAIVQPVELTTESIDSARKRGMAWYSIAKAIGTSEAKVKGLASPELKGRQYPKTVKKADADLIAAEQALAAEQAAKKQERNRKARERRAAKAKKA